VLLVTNDDTCRLSQDGLKENIEQESDRLQHAQPSLKVSLLNEVMIVSHDYFS
jgi:hypothetical protein